MSYIKQDFRCPNCKAKMRLKIYSQVSKEQIDSILSRKIFEVICDKCKEKIILNYPMHLLMENYAIIYDPNEKVELTNSSTKCSRLCKTYEDFKEKIMIFEDGLNDIVIEFIKLFLWEQIDDDTRKNITELRYDGKNEDKLFFSCLGIAKDIFCEENFYLAIKSRAKIKKVGDYALIDSDTFKNYIKMR